MSEPFTGEIRAFTYTFAPRNWGFCDGQLLPIAQNTALYSLIGTAYGGDGVQTFAVPDLRGRVPLHMGQGSGLTPRYRGQYGGHEAVTLNIAQMPSHDHSITLSTLTATLNAINDEGLEKSPGGKTIANSPSEVFSDSAPNVPMHSGSVIVSGTGTCQHQGGGQYHENMQPFVVLSYCICLTGIYPSRS